MNKIKCSHEGCPNAITPKSKEDAEKKKGWKCIHHGGSAVDDTGEPIVA